jgi:putative membrane protein
VFIVLASFAMGCAFGVLAMVPSWWRHRRVAKRHTDDVAALAAAPAPASAPDSVLQQPPRDGL